MILFEHLQRPNSAEIARRMHEDPEVVRASLLRHFTIERNGKPAFASASDLAHADALRLGRETTPRRARPDPVVEQRVSLVTPSQMRSAQYLSTSGEHGGPHTEMRVGPVVGPMEATVYFDLLAPPGTAQSPVPFTTQEIYTFVDAGGQTIGTLTAGIEEGVSFRLDFPAAPGQAGVRFAGFGPVTGGTGALAGARGMLTVNSLIGISPHTLSLIHVLHLVDPGGRFRSIRGGG